MTTGIAETETFTPTAAQKEIARNRLLDEDRRIKHGRDGKPFIDENGKPVPDAEGYNYTRISFITPQDPPTEDKDGLIKSAQKMIERLTGTEVPAREDERGVYFSLPNPTLDQLIDRLAARSAEQMKL